MKDRFVRQSFLGADSEVTLGQLRVGIVGLGGGGSHVVQQLAHVGVGHFVLVDCDRIEATNLNRLVGGTWLDVWMQARKTRIAARQIRRINPRASSTQVHDKWQTAPKSLLDCDVIVGCLDTFAGRLQLEALARRYLIPYIDIGMDVFEVDDGFGVTGQVALSLPSLPCLRCMNVILAEWADKEAAGYGAAGGRPQVVWPNGLLASLAVGTLVRLATPWHHRPPELLLEYDGNTGEVAIGSIACRLQAECGHFSHFDNLGDPWFKLDG